MPYKDPEKNRECRRRYAERNKEKLALQKKEYYQKNKETINKNREEYRREYYEKNKELLRKKGREHARRYRANNKEKVKASKDDYVNRNRAKVYEYQRKWRVENRDTYNQQQRESYFRNIDKRKEYGKEHYQENKGYYNQKRREYKTAMLEWISNMKKEQGCRICGTNEKLEYHHIDPFSKTMEISAMVAQLKNRDEILEEIKKCEVLCSPCHRYTHKTKGRPRKNKKIQDNKLDNYT